MVMKMNDKFLRQRGLVDRECGFAIYDGKRNFLRNLTGVEQIDDCKPDEYKLPLQVPHGKSNLSKTVFAHFKKTMYPSLNFSREHSTKNTIGAFVVNIPGVVSSRDRSVVNYQVLIDSRSFAEINCNPQAYVLSPKCEKIEHENIFEKGRCNILPQREISALCLGNIQKTLLMCCRTEEEKLVFLLHRVFDVLSNPNPEDEAQVRRSDVRILCCQI
jgi:hypothetical protein